MNNWLLSLGFLIMVLALLPWAIPWLKNRAMGQSAALGSVAKIVSVLALGPQQRMVTVEFGLPGQRRCLILGVTQQSVTCLESIDLANDPLSGGLKVDLGPQADARL